MESAAPPLPVSKTRKLPARGCCLDISVIVKDRIIGTGPNANPGRRLSISCVVTLPYNFIIFNKNTGDPKVSKVKGGNGGPLTLCMSMGRVH